MTRDDVESGRAAASTVSGDLAWELLGAVSQFRNNVERYKWYISAISTIRFLAILNITYSLVGLTFLLLAQFPPNDWQIQRIQFLHLGLVISFFSPIALCADLLALRGLRKWKRLYILPWLAIYAVLLGLTFATFVTEVYHRGIRWHLLLIGICIMIIFSRWRHVSIQYKLMALYPEQPSQQIIDDLAGEIHVVASASAQPPIYEGKDLPPPPKYEDLEQPPQYEEGMAQGVVERKEEITAEISSLRRRLEGDLGSEEKSQLTLRMHQLESKLAALEA